MKKLPFRILAVLLVFVLPSSPRQTRHHGTTVTAPPLGEPAQPQSLALTSPPQSAFPAGSPADLTVMEQNCIATQIAAAQYWFTSHDGQWGRGKGLTAPCPEQNFQVHADERGVAFKLGSTTDFSMEMQGVRSVAPREEKSRIVYDRGDGLEEWYVNTDAGVEQGFTIREKPALRTAPLTLTLNFLTALRAEQSPQNGRVTFRDPGTGAVQLMYDKLEAWDADGQTLPASMELAEGGSVIKLQIQDAAARYPVTVDPLFFTRVATFEGEILNQNFGKGLALSAKTLVIATESLTAADSAAYVFEQSVAGWTMSRKILPPAGGAFFGSKVAIDGDRMVIGTAQVSGAIQGAFLHERNSGGPNNWGLVKTFNSNVPAAFGFFGVSVGVSGDTVAVGARGEFGAVANSGAVSIFQENQGGTGTWGLQRRISPADGAGGDQFGGALALHGDRLLVGAVDSNSAGPEAGACYIFERAQGGPNLWGQVKKLLPPTPSIDGSFGVSVAMDGDRVIVGEVLSSTHSSANGAAHIFQRNRSGLGLWGLDQSLSVVDGNGSSTRFGSSVALLGTRCLVGAFNYDSHAPLGTGGGAAFAFELINGLWTRTVDVLPDVPQTDGAFGSAVALSDSVVVVGANRESTSGGANRGRAHAWFLPTGQGAWIRSAQPAILSPGTVTVRDLGAAVALSGSTLVVGAPQSEDSAISGTDEGAAYVFERNQGGPDAWQLKRRLAASSLGGGSGFGTSVSVQGDVIAVGAPIDNSIRGEAYLYSRNQGGAELWGEIKRLTSPTALVGEEYGFSVSLDPHGAWLAVGAPGQNNDEGQVHVYFINTGGMNNWGLIRTISHPPVQAFANASGDRFGHAVSLDLSRLLVGAPKAEGSDKFGNAVADCGRGYVFEIDTGGVNDWGLEAEIFVPGSLAFLQQQGVGNALQGTSVSLNGNLAVLGSPGESSNKGSANLYERNDEGANSWTTHRKVTDPTGGASDRFGQSVSLSGTQLAIGAPGSDDFSLNGGQVLLFAKNLGGADQWKLEARLGQVECGPEAALGTSVALCGGDLAAGMPDLGTQGGVTVWRREFEELTERQSLTDTANGFAKSIDMEGDFLVVGADGVNSPLPSTLGAAFVFHRNSGGLDNWGLMKKVVGADSVSDDGFGFSVALSNGILAVGAALEDNAQGNGAGSAYLFYRNQGGEDQWGQIKKLIESDSNTSSGVGVSIALDGEALVIGAGSSEGAYLHERNQGGSNNWGLSRRLNSGLAADAGLAVAVHMNTVLVGGANNTASNQAGVGIFERNQGGAGNWGLVKLLTPPDDADGFGSELALDGHVAVIGAAQADAAGTNVGAAFVFDRHQGGINNWGLVKKLAPLGAVTSGNFGAAVAVERTRIIVAAPTSGPNVRLHIFEQNHGGVNAWGQSAVISNPNLRAC